MMGKLYGYERRRRVFSYQGTTLIVPSTGTNQPALASVGPLKAFFWVEWGISVIPSEAFFAESRDPVFYLSF